MVRPSSLGRLPFALAVALCWSISSCSQRPEHEEAPSLSAPQHAEPDDRESKESEGSGVRPPAGSTTYTIARGGTLLNVANLYKIHHHEILELNPRIDPQTNLAPNTQVVVHLPSDTPSESIGLPHAGRLRGAEPMMDGPGRVITAERWKTWGSHSTVVQLDAVLKRWAKLQPDGPPILVGNISARRGGPLEPHKTHQSGRDVDLSYIARWDGKERVVWQKMNAHNLDVTKTWALIKLLVKHADVEMMFIDRAIQKLLLRDALHNGTLKRELLRKWLEVAPGATVGKTLIRHVAGHDDHLHVRFACRPDEKRCKS